MLTATQCEIVAYVTDGEIVCRDCLVARYSTVFVERLDAGIGGSTHDISPLIRYEVDTLSGERIWEAAEERVSDFEANHPELALALGVNAKRERGFRVARHNGLGRLLSQRWERETLVPEGRNRWRIVDRVADQLGDVYGERCGQCGELL